VCENNSGQVSQFGGIERQPGWEHFSGNGPIALQGEQEIRCSRRVVRGAEDFVLIFL